MADVSLLTVPCPACGHKLAPPLPDSCPACGHHLAAPPAEVLAGVVPLRGPRLLGRHPDGTPFEFELKGTSTAGRQPTCDLVLQDPAVSRAQACFELRGDQWLVRDLGSAGGTWVNARSVREQQLHDGDTIRLGGTTLHFRAGGGGPLEAELARAERPGPTLQLPPDPALLAGASAPDLTHEAVRQAVRFHAALGRAVFQRDVVALLVEAVEAALRPHLLGLHLLENGTTSILRRAGHVGDDDLRAAEAAVQAVLASGSPVQTDDCKLGEQGPSSLLLADIRTLLAVPLLARGRPKGVVYCMQLGARYSQLHRVLLEGLAAHAASALGP